MGGFQSIPPQLRVAVCLLLVQPEFTIQSSLFNVSSILQDPHLNKGHLYFVEEEEFAKHLALHEGSMPEEANTCNNHDAIKLATMHGGKGMAISSIGEAICACHECRQASSVVDLKKGEQYVPLLIWFMQ
ncbi:hypothetical protein IW262DRAFT_1271163 [Armillaria fumosa]|nr:hypothetical protein IW262DRAFT_1271163 [Armillaria fumosa]